MTRVFGFLYNALGQTLVQGKLYVRLQQDMVSVDGTKVVPLTVEADLSQNGGLVDLSLYATVGASPAGLAYFVEFDPDPSDTSKPARSKDGYWSNYWAVPNVPSFSIGNFVSALRGQPSANYMPAGGSVNVNGDNITLGAVASDTPKGIRAAMLSKTPELRFNPLTDVWEFSNDGLAFQEFGSGGFDGGDLSGANATFTGSVVANSFSGLGSGLSNLNASFISSGTLPDGRFPSILPAVSGSNLTNLNASALASGMVPLARIPALLDAQIAAGAAISWGKISKTGSSLADLSTRSASDLTSGVLAVARGGTGGTATPILNGLAYGTGTALAFTAAGGVGQILKVGANGVPAWADPGAASGHNLLSSVHSDVTAAAVARGAMIVGLGATPSWSSLSIGAAGLVLRSNGLEPVWSNDGSALTALNASNIASGTLADARLSANVLKGNAANTFAALQTFDAGARLKNAQSLVGRNAAATADLAIAKLDANDQVIIGSLSSPTVLKGSCNRPPVNVDKDLWVEVTGSSPNKTIAIMFNDGGTVRTLAQITV